MAINKNHLFDDLDGRKCSIVEMNVSPERVKFLKDLLELNGYTVVVQASPPPKAAPGIEAPVPETFSVGVTDLRFNATNAIYGRQLKTRDGHIVTPAFWNQQSPVSRDDIPYFEK